ncbi:hypothetical protein AMTR_s00041p00214940 [Amborella trichopoda]|uniref:Uncharacterized protein n=1 Tax=Amborella trichopoda TaxID=13333 RepID=W1PTX8_AMBTC|nr:hypothetical protein AMTR_s00041p00214940 [Amborella trichopoda]
MHEGISKPFALSKGSMWYLRLTPKNSPPSRGLKCPKMCPFTWACLPQNDNTRPPQPPDHACISWHHRTVPSNASDPAVVLSWSRVTILPFNSTVAYLISKAKEGEITSKRSRAIWFEQVPIVRGPSVYVAIFYTLADGRPTVVQHAVIFRSSLLCRWTVEIGLEREFLTVDLQ